MTSILPAVPADLPRVLALLRESGLPVAGVTEHQETLLVARDGDRIVGCAAVEQYGDHGLLRSVAVEANEQGSGLGHRLVDAALDLARQRGIRDLFLLTTTAEKYFPRFGFDQVDRTVVPEAVRQSIEFTSACPASAIVMRKYVAAA